MQKVNKKFYVGAWLIGMLVYWLVWVLISVLRIYYPDNPAVGMIMLPASWFSLLAAIAALILIYKMWAAIEGFEPRTTPAKALGFMFIPLFNIYWHFVVYLGWTQDYNKIKEQNDEVELPRMPEDIALWVCILPLLSVGLMITSIAVWGLAGMSTGPVQWLLIIVGLADILLKAFLFSKICDGINALANAVVEPLPEEYPEEQPEASLSGLAIASLVLGILSIFTCGLTALPGLILGIIALVMINNSNRRLKGKGLAIGGIATSVTAGALIMVAGITTMLFVPSRYDFTEKENSTTTNAKQLASFFSMYNTDYDGLFPPSESWPDAIGPYLYGNSNILYLPNDEQQRRIWAMNEQLEGLTVSEIQRPEITVMIFESKFDSPLAGGPELLPDKPRDSSGYVIAFVDGHVEFIRPQRVNDLLWSVSPY